MSIFTGNRIRLAPVSEAPRTLGADARDGTVTFVRPLRGWDGQPIAGLLVRNESLTVRADSDVSVTGRTEKEALGLLLEAVGKYLKAHSEHA